MGLIEELVASARERARALPRRSGTATGNGDAFRDALRGKVTLSVIAEYKQASPSLGAIAERGLEEQLERYVSGGASAVSVLTEPSHFRGSLDHLERAARVSEVPLLMKDFVVDPAQVHEAAHRGASAVLLIVRCLSGRELRELAAACSEHQLAALVECHTAKEVAAALSLDDDVVLGVNNRDLDSLEIDRTRAPKLLADIPSERIVVAESGYESGEDVASVRGIADAVLVGSALMKRDHPRSLIQELRG